MKDNKPEQVEDGEEQKTYVDSKGYTRPCPSGKLNKVAVKRTLRINYINKRTNYYG